MCYATGIAYNTGKPNQIFRPISAAQEICGASGTSAESFSYVYYANPLDMITLRYCVATCPKSGDASMVTPSATVAFTANINSDGTAAGSWTSTSIISYDS